MLLTPQVCLARQGLAVPYVEVPGVIVAHSRPAAAERSISNSD